MNVYDEYKVSRQLLVDKCKQSVYQGQKFSSDFEKANQIFIDLLVAHTKSHNNKWYQTCTIQHKDEIEKSDIFRILKTMPKGAIHHLHGDCALDFDQFFEEFAYQDTTYYNPVTKEIRYVRSGSQCGVGFEKLKILRDQASDKEIFQNSIFEILHLSPQVMKGDTNIWDEFESRIFNLTGFLYQQSNYPKYLKRVLQNLIADGVRRVEIKIFLGWIMGDDGNPLTWEQYHDIVMNVVGDLQLTTPDFTFGVIVQGLKIWDLNEQEAYLRKTFECRKKNPEFLLGYDLVQEEDTHANLLTCAEILTKIPLLEKEYGVDMPLFLHGGESLDSLGNTNLYDIILLKCKRVGHGISLVHHSFLLDMIKKNEICLECCPVSNQCLRYIDDIRMHPLKTFLNYGVKVSINSDDPALFGYQGITLDFYFAAVGCLLDLKDLKTLVKNSIDFSQCNQQEKTLMRENNEKDFEDFVQKILNQQQISSFL